MRFQPVKRTALDGKTWWVVWDNKENQYCTLYNLSGRYKTKRACQFAIDYYGKENYKNE